MQYRRAKGEAAQKRLFDFYLTQIKKGRVNNWDLVDVTAPIMGGYLIPRSDSMQFLKMLAKSKDLWQRRSAILFTFAYIRKKELEPTITIVKMLINDKHDLIQKASGWALREVGKKNLPLLRSFLKENSSKMGRTSLRYAIEKLPKAERKKWLEIK
jgi:3-methyladenine DNA glycosylase AlkD